MRENELKRVQEYLCTCVYTTWAEQGVPINCSCLPEPGLHEGCFLHLHRDLTCSWGWADGECEWSFGHLEYWHAAARLSVSRQPDTHMCSHHRLDVCQLVRERRMYPSPGPWLHGKSSVLPSLCLWKWCFILSRWSFLSYSPTFSYPHLLGMWYMRPLSVSGTHSECGVQQSYSQTCTLSNSVFSSSTAVKISSTRECYAAHVSRSLLYLSQGYSLQVTN